MAPKRTPTKGKPSPKKQKVVTPEEEAVAQIEGALRGAVGAELAACEKEMLLGIVTPALAQAKEARHPLEAKLGALVGEGLLAAGKSLGAAAAETTAAWNEQRGVEANAREGAELAKEKLQAAAAAEEKADGAVDAAEQAQGEAETAHAKQQKEEAGLDKAASKLQENVQTYTSALEVVRSSEPSAAETKKLVATLKACGAPPALVDGIAKAVGKEGACEALFVGEAVKVLEGKLAEAQGALGNWPGHVAGVQAATVQAAAAVEAAKEALTAREAERNAANANQKQAKQDLKGAEAALKEASKGVEKAGKSNEKALAQLGTAEEAGKAFDFLYSRSAAVAEDNAAQAMDADL